MLCHWGITHVYIGQGQGLVSFGNTQLFSPQELMQTASFRLVYHEDRVYIFSLEPEACEAGSG
jgi:hypothetical protein